MTLIQIANWNSDDNSEIYLIMFSFNPKQAFQINFLLLSCSFIICLILINIERLKGLTSSVLMFLFWSLLALASIFQIKKEINNHQHDALISAHLLILDIIYFCGVYCMTVLSCLAEKHTLTEFRKKEVYFYFYM